MTMMMTMMVLAVVLACVAYTDATQVGGGRSQDGRGDEAAAVRRGFSGVRRHSQFCSHRLQDDARPDGRPHQQPVDCVRRNCCHAQRLQGCTDIITILIS